MRKTDIEIAADAIKYCRKELNEYQNLIERVEENDCHQVSERTLRIWAYKIKKLEFILGERDISPIPFGIKNTYTEKEGDAITEIISLDNAFNLLSNRIGENSTYKILSVELGYRLTERYGEGNLYRYGEGTPIWRIITMNENDTKNYVFEIDCVTGKIRSREKKLY